MHSSKTRSTASITCAVLFCAVAGPIGAWVAISARFKLPTEACGSAALLTLLILAPLLEEYVFRVGLHTYLMKQFPRKWRFLSAANLLTALAFGLAHAVYHGIPAELALAIPALAMGWAWECSGRRVIFPVLLHSWFNACLFWLAC